VRDELGWLADRLGTVRDLDVMLEHFAPQVATLDPAEQEALATAFLGRMQHEHERARTGLLAALASERYFQLLDLLAEPVQLTASGTEGAGAAAGLSPAGTEGAEGADGAVGATAADMAGADGATPADVAGVAGMPAEATLPALAAAEVERFRKALRRLDEDSPDEALHATRIRGKRARYACELARPLAGKGIDSLIAATKALQDVLGEHQDSSVAEECIRRYLGRSRSATALPAGRLVERERQRRAAARTALPAAYRTFRDAARKAFP
jgi:CHAD domain-containing protein